MNRSFIGGLAAGLGLALVVWAYAGQDNVVDAINYPVTPGLGIVLVRPEGNQYVNPLWLKQCAKVRLACHAGPQNLDTPEPDSPGAAFEGRTEN